MANSNEVKVPCGGFELSSTDFYIENKTLHPYLTGGAYNMMML